MTRRLTTILMTIFLIGIISPFVWAQDTDPQTTTLKGISVVPVLVEDLSDGAKTLGLTKDAIQIDVELKLRLAGMQVVTPEEARKLPGVPALVVDVVVPPDARVANVLVALIQTVQLVRNGGLTFAKTWETATLVEAPTAQGIRNFVKDRVDQFLNAWLSVNPKH